MPTINGSCRNCLPRPPDRREWRFADSTRDQKKIRDGYLLEEARGFENQGKHDSESGHDGDHGARDQTAITTASTLLRARKSTGRATARRRSRDARPGRRRISPSTRYPSTTDNIEWRPASPASPRGGNAAVGHVPDVVDGERDLIVGHIVETGHGVQNQASITVVSMPIQAMTTISAGRPHHSAI